VRVDRVSGSKTPPLVPPTHEETPLEKARRLREEAYANVQKGYYEDAADELNEAAEIDPAGDADPRVAKARYDIAVGDPKRVPSATMGPDVWESRGRSSGDGGAAAAAASVSQGVEAEHQSEAVENLADTSRCKVTDSFGQPLAIYRPYLRDVHHAGSRKVRLSLSEANVAWHRRQSEVGSDGSDDSRLDRAPVEAIVLNDEGRPAPLRFRAVPREPKPVDLPLPHHQRSSVQSVPASSSTAADRRCARFTRTSAKSSSSFLVISASLRARTATDRTRVI
jgi:hypothetical protein